MPIASLAPPRRGAGANHPPIHGQAPVSGGRDTEGRTIPMDQGVPAGRWVCWAAVPRFSLRDLGATTKPICSQLLLCL